MTMEEFLLNEYSYVKADFDKLKIPYKDVPVIINTRAKSRHGCCKKKGNEMHIEISSFVLSYPVQELRNTIAHEMIHTCYNCFNHGKTFKKYAEKLNSLGYNVTTTYKGELKTPAEKHPNYLLICQGCGEKIYRTKKSRIILYPEQYRCKKCKGKFKAYSLNYKS